MSRETLGCRPRGRGFCFMLAHFSHFFAFFRNFFDILTHLKLSCNFLTIFCDFSSIFESFEQVLDRFWLGSSFDFVYLFVKSDFVKKRVSPGQEHDF